MTHSELEQLNVRQLRQVCRDRKLTGYSAIVKQGKQALIDWMCDRIGDDEPQTFGHWLDQEAVLAEAAKAEDESVMCPVDPPCVPSQIHRLRTLIAHRSQSDWHLLRAWLMRRLRMAIA
ncbi:MAG: hypothetical protein AAFY15_04645 [Cyanobacteria bacterium J06648_11]